MKVVLFCGGLGTRLREHSETIPKPLVTIGSRPIVWHLMRYYAHFGHKQFVLCLGHLGNQIREYFLKYDECLSNDFTLSQGGRKIELHSSDIDDWEITFVDTGLNANIGERLLAVKRYVDSDDSFLANYSDGLADIPLDAMIRQFQATDQVASFASVRSWASFHVAESEDGVVTSLGPMRQDRFLINGGFFVFRRSIFDYIRPGEELVEAPFARLIAERRLGTYCHTGFWRPMDTLKDKIALDAMEACGKCPWMVWKK